jgi:hypothetical protein
MFSVSGLLNDAVGFKVVQQIVHKIHVGRGHIVEGNTIVTAATQTLKYERNKIQIKNQCTLVKIPTKKANIVFSNSMDSY